MTWGTQNTKNEAFEQIDMALDHNVNIIDMIITEQVHRFKK